MEQVLKFQKFFKISVKPGSKLCTSCRKILREADQEPVDSESQEEDVEFTPAVERVEKLNASIANLTDVSPLKPSQIGTQDKISYGKRKWHEIKEVTREGIAECLHVEPEAIAECSKESNIRSYAPDDMEHLVASLKEKLKISNRQQQISLLTLTPKSWTIATVATEFGVTQYTVRKARNLPKQHGILPALSSARGKPLSHEIVQLVKQFYCEDDVSRIMPGAKDYVSVKEGDTRVHKQRRFLLLNLNELHVLFKDRNPE